MDRLQVEKSQIVLAYVGVPSLGVGQELEIAREKNIPIVLLMEKNAVISRMARGNPMVTAEIRFSDFQDRASTTRPLAARVAEMTEFDQKYRECLRQILENGI